jgi:photosystem I P700 chlorophyll a apoprotein A2
LTQLAILLFWSASHLFHIAWLGNFFVQARFVGLVHFAVGYVFTYGPLRDLGASAALSNASSLSVVSTSGLYQWYFTVGMTSESQLLHAAALLCATGTGLLVAAFFHSRAVF